MFRDAMPRPPSLERLVPGRSRPAWVRSDLRLDPNEVIEACEGLRARIDKRFPDSNLAAIATELRDLAQRAVPRTEWIRRPLRPLQIGVGVGIVALLVVPALALRGASVPAEGADLADVVQGIEAALSCAVFLGAATLFLVTIEMRVKRRRALRALNELRVLAHVVDMDQLGADPVDFTPARVAEGERARMRPDDLTRALVYCGELLALTSKIAALYAHDFDDPVVLSGVDGLQRLLDGLSQRISYKASLAVRGGVSSPAALLGRLVGIPA
jgi:hypothetical protein